MAFRDVTAVRARTQTCGVSGWRRCVRRRANARKYRDYSGDHKNRKYAAVSRGFVADEPVAREPVSGAESPCFFGKCRESLRKCSEAPIVTKPKAAISQ